MISYCIKWFTTDKCFCSNTLTSPMLYNKVNYKRNEHQCQDCNDWAIDDIFIDLCWFRGSRCWETCIWEKKGRRNIHWSSWLYVSPTRENIYNKEQLQVKLCEGHRYRASKGPSIFLDKSTFLERSKGLCLQGRAPYTLMFSWDCPVCSYGTIYCSSMDAWV